MIFPYLAIAVFIIGHLYRYAADPYGWTAKSSELLEKEKLKWGSQLFHWGMVFVLLGHVGGLLVPIQAYQALGVGAEAYHFMAVTVGGLSGAAVLAGLLILAFRRFAVRRIREISSTGDLVAVGLLIVVAGLGIFNTIGYNLLVGSYEYRLSVGPWLRSLLAFSPSAGLMERVPLPFKLHILAAFGLVGLWPFTRLVHVWSIPLEYLGRVPILFRTHNPKRAEGVN